MSKSRPTPVQESIRLVTPEPAAQRGESRLLGLLITDVLTARPVAPPSPPDAVAKKSRKRSPSG
jgi:hypothetical protein